MSLITLPSGIIAPIYVGWVYDITHSYIMVFTQALTMPIVGMVMLFFFDPPKKRPEVVSDIKRCV